MSNDPHGTTFSDLLSVAERHIDTAHEEESGGFPSHYAVRRAINVLEEALRVQNSPRSRVNYAEKF